MTACIDKDVTTILGPSEPMSIDEHMRLQLLVSWGVIDEFPSCTGLLLDRTHSWTAVFGMAAAVYTAGYIGFALYGSAKQEFD